MSAPSLSPDERFYSFLTRCKRFLLCPQVIVGCAIIVLFGALWLFFAHGANAPPKVISAANPVADQSRDEALKAIGAADELRKQVTELQTENGELRQQLETVKGEVDAAHNETETARQNYRQVVNRAPRRSAVPADVDDILKRADATLPR